MSDDKKGIYSKYKVQHSDTGLTVEGDCFVLRPDRDIAAFRAMVIYSEHTPNRKLADDIDLWLTDIAKKGLEEWSPESLMRIIWRNKI